MRGPAMTLGCADRWGARRRNLVPSPATDVEILPRGSSGPAKGPTEIGNSSVRTAGPSFGPALVINTADSGGLRSVVEAGLEDCLTTTRRLRQRGARRARDAR